MLLLFYGVQLFIYGWSIFLSYIYEIEIISVNMPTFE